MGLLNRRYVTVLLGILFLALLSMVPITAIANDDGNEFAPFDMNDRHATIDGDAEGSGKAKVKDGKLSFELMASNLMPNKEYEIKVSIREDGSPIDNIFAVITYHVTTDSNGSLEFRKKNFNMELLAPGTYRVDYFVTLPTELGSGSSSTNAPLLRAALGRDPLLACEPATTGIIVNGDDGDDNDDHDDDDDGDGDDD